MHERAVRPSLEGAGPHPRPRVRAIVEGRSSDTMSGYKKDQGRMARLTAFWTLAVLTFYGCMSLHATLTGRVKPLAQPLVESFPSIPVLGTDLTGAFLIAAVVCAAGIFLLLRFLEKPKYADMLIETEQELRKVTWPTGQEVVNSSVVVVICVLFLMGFLAASDWFLAKVTQVILFGGS